MAEHTTPTSSPPPAPVGTSDEDFDRLSGQASLPEDTVSLCLNAKLRREYEEVKARIAERDAERTADATRAAADANPADVRLASRGPAKAADERDPEQDRLDQLVEQMRGQMVTFLLRAIPGQDYDKLLEAHPPRTNQLTGRYDPRDYQGFNVATFPPALVRASIVRPTMTDARWAKLNEVLTNAQSEKLTGKALDLNRREDDLPF